MIKLIEVLAEIAIVTVIVLEIIKDIKNRVDRPEIVYYDESTKYHILNWSSCRSCRWPFLRPAV